jgi:triacylglycerol lipase
MKLPGRNAKSATAAAFIATTLALTACSSGGNEGASSPSSDPGGSSDRAVVIVSGGAAVSPFTTPNAACTAGLAAGNTDTFLREHLLGQGMRVFTSPAMTGDGPVQDQTGFGAFGDCPEALPAEVTVNSVGDIDLAGEHLARFFSYLNTEYGIKTVDIVGHSMGGLFSRSAIKVVKATDSPVAIRSLTTLGTPWQGTFLGDYANGSLGLEACDGDAFCEQSMKAFKSAADQSSIGSAQEVTVNYLAVPEGWNDRQGAQLDGIPVVLLGGDVFTGSDKEGALAQVWPNDGIVALESAFAAQVTDVVLPHRKCVTLPNTHSIYVSDAGKLGWDTALTWNDQSGSAVVEAINGADTALETPNRDGCPAA